MRCINKNYSDACQRRNPHSSVLYSSSTHSPLPTYHGITTSQFAYLFDFKSIKCEVVGDQTTSIVCTSTCIVPRHQTRKMLSSTILDNAPFGFDTAGIKSKSNNEHHVNY